MKSLAEIKEAIAQLPSEQQRQLLKDIPTLCSAVFPREGWDAILADASPRPALTSLVDKLDAEYGRASERFMAVNEDSLREKK